MVGASEAGLAAGERTGLDSTWRPSLAIRSAIIAYWRVPRGKSAIASCQEARAKLGLLSRSALSAASASALSRSVWTKRRQDGQESSVGASSAPHAAQV
jgi:hypothetical protein